MHARGPLLACCLALAGCLGAPPPGQEPGADQPLGRVTIPEDLAFTHHHAAFALFILGERVAFNHTDFDLRAVRNKSAHLHVAEEHGGGIVHLEGDFPGGTPDVTLQAFLRIHGVRFEPGALALGTRGTHNGSLWVDSEEHRWRVWAQPRNDTWAERPEGPLLLLRDGMRVLVSYGRLDAQPLEEETAAVPPPP